jgi:hypothetical protein
MPQTGEPQIVYIPRPDATTENEAATLVNVYAFVLRCAEEREKGGPATAPDDAQEVKNGCATTKNHTTR